MSRLENIILECANKVLAGKEEKLGDYIDPTKQQVKELVYGLIDSCYIPETKQLNRKKLLREVEEL